MLKARFGEIAVNEGHEISFLGMQIMINEMKTMIDKTFFVQNLLKGKKVNMAKSPGTKNMFIVDESLPLLDEQKWQEFHSLVAKFLYLMK